MERVLVLNASYEPLNVCSLRRAHVLVWKGKAEVLESHGQPLRSSTSTFTRPHVIRLVAYVRVPRGVLPDIEPCQGQPERRDPPAQVGKPSAGD